GTRPAHRILGRGCPCGRCRLRPSTRPHSRDRAQAMGPPGPRHRLAVPPHRVPFRRQILLKAFGEPLVVPAGVGGEDLLVAGPPPRRRWSRAPALLGVVSTRRLVTAAPADRVPLPRADPTDRARA